MDDIRCSCSCAANVQMGWCSVGFPTAVSIRGRYWISLPSSFWLHWWNHQKDHHRTYYHHQKICHSVLVPHQQLLQLRQQPTINNQRPVLPVTKGKDEHTHGGVKVRTNQDHTRYHKNKDGKSRRLALHRSLWPCMDGWMHAPTHLSDCSPTKALKHPFPCANNRDI